jgi:hypothetical protein
MLEFFLSKIYRANGRSRGRSRTKIKRLRNTLPSSGLTKTLNKLLACVLQKIGPVISTDHEARMIQSEKTRL